MKTATHTLSIDLVPYTVEKIGEKKFTMENFPFDVRVPERWTNRQGGDYCGLGEFQIYQAEDMSLEIYAPCDVDTEDFLEEFEEVLSNHFDALKEIGWEALNQVD